MGGVPSGDARVGRRVPHVDIDTVENAVHVVVPIAEQPVETGGTLRREDLA